MADPIQALPHALHPSPWEYIHDSPLYPDQMGFIRFFNGTTAPFPIHIALDRLPFAAGSMPLTVTAYEQTEPGNRRVRLLNGTEPEVLHLEERVTIPQGGFSTAVLADSFQTGLQLFQLTDMPRQLEADGSSCLRVFNGAMEGQPLSLIQWNGSLLWEQIPFGSATPYCTTEPQAANFYVLAPGGKDPLASLALFIRPSQNYTIFLTGNTWTPGGLRIIAATDGAADDKAAADGIDADSASADGTAAY